MIKNFIKRYFNFPLYYQSQLQEENLHLKGEIEIYKMIAKMKLGDPLDDNDWELKANEPIPPILGFVCMIMTNAINNVEGAENYIEFQWEAPAGKTFKCRIDRINK